MAAHTFDPAEYLVAPPPRATAPAWTSSSPAWRPGRSPSGSPTTCACHLQAQNIGLKSRDLLKLAGIKCDLVQRCSGIDGTWGYRADNFELARKVAAPLAREVKAAGNEVVCGDCPLANGAIYQETGTRPRPPDQLIARAYGIRRGAAVSAVSELTVADILDLRAYERVRDDFRRG